MSVTKSEIRAGAYFDSLVLMQLQRSLAALPSCGVQVSDVEHRRSLVTIPVTLNDLFRRLAG